MENIIIAIIQTKYFDFSDAISFEFLIIIFYRGARTTFG